MIEDAPAGVRAGRAAGMTVWAVTTTHTPDELAARTGSRRTSPRCWSRSGCADAQRMLMSELSPTMKR